MGRLLGGTNGHAAAAAGYGPNILGQVQPWTISAWVYINSIVNNSAVIAHQYSGTTLPLVLSTGNGGAEGTAGAMFAGFYSGANWHVANEGVSQPVGRWVHWAGVYERYASNVVSLYKNGQLVARDTQTGGGAQNALSGQAFWVGRNWGGSPYLNGRVENVCVWAEALPYEFITRISRLRGMDPRPFFPHKVIAYWPLYGSASDPDGSASQSTLTGSGDTGPVETPPDPVLAAREGVSASVVRLLFGAFTIKQPIISN